jgi:hypothetical protein
MTTFHLAVFFINNYLENAIKKEKPPWLTDGQQKLKQRFCQDHFTKSFHLL